MTRGFVVYIWLYFFRKSWWRRWRWLLYLRRFRRRRWGHGRCFSIFISECFLFSSLRQIIFLLCVIFFDHNGHCFLPSYRTYRWITGKKRVIFFYNDRWGKFCYIHFGRCGRWWGWRKSFLFLCVHSQRGCQQQT